MRKGRRTLQTAGELLDRSKLRNDLVGVYDVFGTAKKLKVRSSFFLSSFTFGHFWGQRSVEAR
jgi:hypothetical protein